MRHHLEHYDPPRYKTIYQQETALKSYSWFSMTAKQTKDFPEKELYKLSIAFQPSQPQNHLPTRDPSKIILMVFNDSEQTEDFLDKELSKMLMAIEYFRPFFSINVLAQTCPHRICIDAVNTRSPNHIIAFLEATRLFLRIQSMPKHSSSKILQIFFFFSLWLTIDVLYEDRKWVLWLKKCLLYTSFKNAIS